MSIGLLGRAMTIAGIVTGLLAIGLPFAFSTRYVEDGTAAAFLLVLLSFASWLPAEIGRDLLAAASGAVAFGFFLFLPSTAAFNELGYLEAGAWLGLCTVLIPIGALVIWIGSTEPGSSRSARPASPLAGLGFPVALAGLVLAVVGIWLEAVDGGSTYWNIASSGHAVGILMLLLVVLNAVLVAGPALGPIPTLGNLDVLVAAATFGFVAGRGRLDGLRGLRLAGAGRLDRSRRGPPAPGGRVEVAQRRSPGGNGSGSNGVAGSRPVADPDAGGADQLRDDG